MTRWMIPALSLAMVATPGAAAPDWVGGQVTFERPVRYEKTILGGESIWFCEGTACQGRAPSYLRSAQRYCRELARWGGPVTSFRAGTVIFDADALRRCNGTR
jgi:hypothetical protein